MSGANPKMRAFAKRLIAYETTGNKSSQTISLVDFPICDKLRPQLANLMGNAGFRSLLSRALTLANAEVPWLRAVHVKADGSLEGLGELKTQVVSAQIEEGEVVLLAQLLGLLMTFIGEDLTLRLVHDVSPKVPLNDLDFSEKGQNEKTK